MRRLSVIETGGAIPEDRFDEKFIEENEITPPMEVSSGPLSGKTVYVARGLTALTVLASLLGLLSIPMSVYDDSLMIVGARLVAAGKLPYLDFYTHYGPLGYTLIESLSRATQSPILAMRILQAALLLLVAVLLHVAVRFSSASPNPSEAAAPLAVLALSGSAAFPSFLGFGLAVASLLMFVVARSIRWSRAAATWSIGAGVVLALAALNRPAFALYAAGAFLLTEIVLFRSRREERSWAPPALFLAGTIGGGALSWFLLYPFLSPRVAFQAALVTPLRLHGSGSRYLEPGFLRSPLAAICLGATIAATLLVWTFFTSSRRIRLLGVTCSIGIGLFPVLYRLVWPERELAFFGFVVFAICLLPLWNARRFLTESRDLGGAVIVGLAAGAFAHYLWTRFDGTHMLPSFGLAASSAALLWTRMRVPGRVVVVALFLLTYQIAVRNSSEPIHPLARLSGDAFPVSENGKLRWSYENVPSDSAMAVALADSKADPRSRFVALASSHAVSQGNPVMLFALSSRLPYTKWFQYDPGLQTSSPIQNQMKREIVESGSRTAVVWRADRFLFDRKRVPLSQSELDAFFGRLYPRVIGRFGDFEVRERVGPDREASK
jgi:hypothetical protein